MFFGVLAVQVPLLLNENIDFLHLTDIHLDQNYVVGSTLESQCHRKRKHTAEAGPLGNPESPCDSPLELVIKAFEKLEKLKTDVIIWTGDNARHDGDSSLKRTWNEIMEENKVVTNMVSNSFRGKPIVPSIGNNDVHPHNLMQYSETGTPILEFYSKIWNEFIPKEQLSTFKHLGSFYRDVSKLRIVSLNTMYLFVANTEVDDCRKSSEKGPQSAGDFLLDWLENKVLATGRLNSKFVYISGHVPPSIVNYKQNCYNRISDLFTEYRDIIQGQFYGHMNIDHFYFPTRDQKLSKSDSGVSKLGEIHHMMNANIAPSWVFYYFSSLIGHYKRIKRAENLPTPIHVSPSLVPSFNPAFRIYHISSQNFGIQSFTQYFMDLAQETPQFRIEYSADKEYPLTSFDITGWHNLAKKLSKKKFLKLRKKYFNHLVVGRDENHMPRAFNAW